MRSRHQDRAPGFVGSGPASLVGASAHDDSAASGRTNDAFDEKGCIVSRPEDFSAATSFPEGERSSENVVATPPGIPSQGRLDWMRRWAEAWLENLKDRPAERYYADLPLEVACDMILELTEAT